MPKGAPVFDFFEGVQAIFSAASKSNLVPAPEIIIYHFACCHPEPLSIALSLHILTRSSRLYISCDHDLPESRCRDTA